MSWPDRLFSEDVKQVIDCLLQWFYRRSLLNATRLDVLPLSYGAGYSTGRPV
jgi:hypothetical protein